MSVVSAAGLASASKLSIKRKASSLVQKNLRVPPLSTKRESTHQAALPNFAFDLIFFGAIFNIKVLQKVVAIRCHIAILERLYQTF